MRPAELVLVAVSGYATWTDLRTRRIPNALTFPAMVVGVALAAYEAGVPGASESLLGLAAGFGALFPFWATGGTGAGDVKLVMATGALVGWKVLVPSFLLGGALIGLYSLAAVFRHGAAVGGVLPFLLLMRSELAAGTPMDKRVTGIWLPWGPCLALGALLAVAGRWRPLG